MKINTKSFAFTCAIIWGMLVFLATMWIVVIGSRGLTLSLLGKFYLGYTVSIWGAFIGLFWGFVDGLVLGFIFAWLYNLLLPKKDKI